MKKKNIVLSFVFISTSVLAAPTLVDPNSVKVVANCDSELRVMVTKLDDTKSPILEQKASFKNKADCSSKAAQLRANILSATEQHKLLEVSSSAEGYIWASVSDKSIDHLPARRIEILEKELAILKAKCEGVEEGSPTINKTH